MNTYRPRRPERPKGVEPLEAILKRVVDRRGRIRGCGDEELQAAWQRAAGERLARHTAVQRLRGDTLYVTVDSAVLQQQLAGFRHEELLAALQEQFYRTYIRQIRFLPGPMRGRRR